MLNKLNALRELIEKGLEDHLPESRLERAESLNEVVRAAVFPGGKRMRPLLTLGCARLVNASLSEALPAACAVEFLHTSSLILDDLPGMDDAHMRRGRPALHCRFGEGSALLAALALLNKAYGLFGKTPELLREATFCIGVDGMIGGQAIDLAAAEDRGSPFPFEARNRKTSALMRLTFTSGAIAAGGSREEVDVLAHVGECLGEAYQICDDLLDQRLECEVTGKTSRQDERLLRPSHATEFGLAQSMAHVNDLVGGAKKALAQQFPRSTDTQMMLLFIDRIVGEFKFEAAATA